LAVLTTGGSSDGREITIARNLDGRNHPVSTITSTMPPAPEAPAWIPSPLYRMTVEEYEALVASGAFRGLSIVDEIDADLHRAARLRQRILKRAFEGRLVPRRPADEPADRLLERILQARAGEATDPPGPTR